MSATTEQRIEVQPTVEKWGRHARYFPYAAAADPLASGAICPVPIERFSADLYRSGPTRIVPLDLSSGLGLSDGPATSPSLLANFVRVTAGDLLTLSANATSHLIYAIGGSGMIETGGEEVAWERGDIVTLPSGHAPVVHARTDATLYWVHDGPLLAYLGVVAVAPRFVPTKFSFARSMSALAQVADDPRSAEQSRVSVLLANMQQTQTLTITHVLWAMVGVVEPHSVQRAHRHQSVALDFCLEASAGCYTLIGDEINAEGCIVDPIRMEWETGSAFVTPPGRWHSHHNESADPAYIIPIQDAGLHTYLRTLDIQFGRGTGVG